MTILVTGGAGYIGSHVAVELLNNNYNVVIVDNLYNSSIETIDNIKKITGKDFKFYEGDLCNKVLLKKVFTDNKIDAVMHFAGYKAVGESVSMPLKYYRNNIDSTLTLLEVMSEYDCKKIVFSSSATVYGIPDKLPIAENSKLSVTNPYGATKLYIEGILNDIYISDNNWGIVILRYFNPVGAHSSLLIGEDPKGIPNNLVPYINKVANEELPCLSIYGNTYNTKDGTGIRDYIHIMDLVSGHIKSLDYIFNHNTIEYINLGSGKGYSVLEVVNTYEKVNNVKIPYNITGKRDGDIAECYADISKARELLEFNPNYDLGSMLKSSYDFYINKRNK